MNEHPQDLQSIIFPSSRREDWRELLPRKIINLKPGLVTINCLDWFLSCKDFQTIKVLFDQAGLRINMIQSNIPETIVSASSLGYPALLKPEKSEEISYPSSTSDVQKTKNPCLLFHQGTLRSGENLEAEGDVLLLGDVNPGAKISAGGDVLIWGRLRGIAHAGKEGNHDAKIVALQLRPLQLRIANKVARGPQEIPQAGLAEEAIIEFDQIVIKPARTNSFKTS